MFTSLFHIIIWMQLAASVHFYTNGMNTRLYKSLNLPLCFSYLQVILLCSLCIFLIMQERVCTKLISSTKFLIAAKIGLNLSSNLLFFALVLSLAINKYKANFQNIAIRWKQLNIDHIWISNCFDRSQSFSSCVVYPKCQKKSAIYRLFFAFCTSGLMMQRALKF